MRIMIKLFKNQLTFLFVFDTVNPTLGYFSVSFGGLPFF
jgi:hypothetical protein